MWRILGISLVLVGVAVASGMGLSFVHEAVFDRAVPVRAEVVNPAPVIKRATHVETQTTPAQGPELVLAPTGQPKVVTDVPVAAAYALRQTQELGLAAIGSAAMPAPIQSLRPQMRSLGFLQTHTARLSPDLAQRGEIGPVIRRPRPATVYRPATVTRSVSLPGPSLETASRTLPPKVLIGVYR